MHIAYLRSLKDRCNLQITSKIEFRVEARAGEEKEGIARGE